MACAKTVSIGLPLLSGLNCNPTAVGSLTQGVAASGVSSSLSYTSGNGSTHTGQVVTSTGVTGLTATLAPGTFLAGGGTLVYTITGTPAGNGIASFAINIGGQTCTLTRNVLPVTIPASITMATNQSHLMFSVYDDDYIPYTPPTAAATTNAQAADGNREPIAVNIPASITTSGFVVKIPATGSGSLPAYSQNMTIPASLTQDGVSRVLNFSWPSGALSGGNVNVTIKAIGGNLNLKQLDINAGLGSDGLGVVVAQFLYPFNNSMITTTFTLRIFPGIPDKMFGEPDNAGNRYTHLMLYCPIVAEDGKTWLNNRLGANYSNIHRSVFWPTAQAASPLDYDAYGSLFQWGRRADGHELITWSAGSGVGAGAPVYNSGGPATTLNNTPTDPRFIQAPNAPNDWRVLNDDFLWETEASANNPCPKGFRVPKIDELNTLFTAASILNNSSAVANAFASRLKLTVPGIRLFSSGTFSTVGSYGYFWSSSITGSVAYNRFISGGGTLVSYDARASGFSVVCLKD